MKKDVLIFVLGCLAGIATTIWGVHYSEKIQNEKTTLEQNKLKPLINIKLTEASDGILSLDVESTKPNSAPIRDVFFKFDIPGTFQGLEDTYKDNIDDVDISSSFLASQGPFGIIAETVHVHLRNLYSKGKLIVKIKYKPTKPGLMGGAAELLKIKPALKKDKFIIMPLMDLHNFSRLLYSWEFMGTTISEHDYLDWTPLKYIQDDNLNLIKTWESPEESKAPNPYPDVDAGKAMEDRRKDW